MGLRPQVDASGRPRPACRREPGIGGRARLAAVSMAEEMTRRQFARGASGLRSVRAPSATVAEDPRRDRRAIGGGDHRTRRRARAGARAAAAAMSDAPLVPGALYGLRTWGVAGAPGDERLIGPQRSVPWPSGGALLEAECSATPPHAPPGAACACGLHAWHPTRAAARRVCGVRRDVPGILEASGGRGARRRVPRRARAGARTRAAAQRQPLPARAAGGRAQRRIAAPGRAPTRCSPTAAIAARASPRASSPSSWAPRAWLPAAVSAAAEGRSAPSEWPRCWPWAASPSSWTRA